jgi:heme/copper-type cytochrome/quinol oxidase subunit 1
LKGGAPALRASLFMSMLLFAYGGILGLMIEDQNVVIPAHYHGSIVGTTLAFMGLAYLWLPRFGYGEVAHTKLAFWQPILYGGGQIIHISALAWSGGYGVLRKTPGAELPASAKAAMGLMGLGGLIAIIGGFLFVVVVARAVYRRRPSLPGG